MPELYVYDGERLKREHYAYGVGIEKRLIEILPSLKFNGTPLIRAIIDYDKGNLERVRKLLKNCLAQGHNRPKEDYETDGLNEKEVMQRLNLKPNQILWASPQEQIPKKLQLYYPHDELGLIPFGTLNEFFLLIDGSYYDSDGHLYYQPDVEKRKRALLGVVLFDLRAKRQKALKKDLKFILSEKNLEEVIGEIQNEGYFSKYFL